MRRRYRVWSPPDSSDSGSEGAADAFNPICYFILPPPQYHVHLEDLGELHRAAWLGDVPGLERVLVPGGPGVDKRDSENRTALHLACTSGHPAVVALLVDRKCQLNCFDSNKRTALIKAVQCRKEECATILLDGGADPDLPDIYGNTALHYAVHNEDESLAEKLLSYSTNKEAKNENDLTPLLFAVSGKRQQMVELLLERGANLLAVDKCQRTALILAVQCGSANIVSLLLQQQIDIFSQDTFGRTAEDYAVLNQFTGIQQLISECKEKQQSESVSLSRIEGAFHLYEDSLELKNNEDERLTAEIKQMGNMVSVLQKELSETKETKLQLEHQKIEWELELRRLRLALKQEKEKKENAEMLCNKVNEQLRIKEEECRGKAEMIQELQWTLRKLIKELRMQQTDAQQQLFEEQNARIVQDQILTSKQKELETAQKKMDSEDKMNADMSDLRARNEILSEKHSNAENKISLQIQLDNARDAVGEQNLILEHVQRDLGQTQCQKKEIEQMHQIQQRKLKKYIAKQESIEERLFQLQNKNMLLRQQLGDAHKKVNRQEKTISSLHDQFQALASNIQSQSEKQSLLLQETEEVVMRQHQLEWTDPLKQQPAAEATSFNLDETQDSKKKLGQSSSEDDLTEAQKTAPSRCPDLDADNEVLRQTLFSVKALKKKCQTLEEEKKQLKQEIVNLKIHMERKMLERGEAEQYEVPIEERSRRIVEALKEISLSLQTQAAPQEQLEQLVQRVNDITAEKTQMELTIKDLQSELSRVKTSQAENKIELERYKEYRLNEVKFAAAFSNELRRTMEMTAEVSAQLTVEKEKTRYPATASTTRPFLVSPSVGNLGEGLNRRHIGRESRSSDESMESFMLRDDLTEAQKTAPSRCPDLDADNEVLRQTLFSVKALIRKCQTLEEENKQRKQEIVNLKSYMETQAAPQEQLEQLVQRVNDITAEKTQMELTIKDLQSELSRVKTSQAENKIELERYKDIYVEGINFVRSLSSGLRRTMEMTAEVSAQVTAEKEKTRYAATASTTRPFLVSPSVGNLSEGLNRRHIGRESRSSDESMESFMLRMQQKLDKEIHSAGVTAAIELESEVAHIKNAKIGSVEAAVKEYREVLCRKYRI
ncbi:coiled-coil domain-containing protein 144A-like isoform X2 [Callithrix jacchus]